MFVSPDDDFTVPFYPLELHIAEKFHALTLPRAKPNSRVKDLSDIALMANFRAYDGEQLYEALQRTFTHHCTHPLPVSVPEQAKEWEMPYLHMASEYELQWNTLNEVHQSVVAFLEPILQGNCDFTFDSQKGKWIDFGRDAGRTKVER